VRDDVNVPGTPLCDTEYVAYDSVQGRFHGQEWPDYETGKIYRWNKFTQMWDFSRKMKVLGFTIRGAWIDEIQDFCPPVRAKAFGEADDSEREDFNLG
jgi:hypothetical protein